VKIAGISPLEFGKKNKKNSKTVFIFAGLKMYLKQTPEYNILVTIIFFMLSYGYCENKQTNDVKQY